VWKSLNIKEGRKVAQENQSRQNWKKKRGFSKREIKLDIGGETAFKRVDGTKRREMARGTILDLDKKEGQGPNNDKGEGR